MLIRNGLALSALLVLTAACAAEPEDASNDTSEATQAATSTTQLYLRCQANGWGIDSRTKLAPTSDPYKFSLEFEVTQDWLVAQGDNCTLTDTSNGQRDYGTLDGKTLAVPEQGNVSTRLSSNTSLLSMKYPSLGFYRAIVNWRSGTITVNRLKSQTYLYMRLRFADDPRDYTPQTDAAITSEVEVVRQRYSRWSAGQVAIRAEITPTLTLPRPRADYVGGWVDDGNCNYPEWSGMNLIIDDALVQARAVGYITSNFNVHAVRYDGQPGSCYSFAGGSRNWNRWDNIEWHEWGHNLGMPNEDTISSVDTNPLNPDYVAIGDNMHGAMHNFDENSTWTVPDMRDMGILDEACLIRPTTSGVYRIYTHQVTPVNFDPNRKYALELSDQNGHRKLTFEYHSVVAANVDATASNGLIVLDSYSNVVIDMTPFSRTREASGGQLDRVDAPLLIGRSVTAWDNSWTVTPLAKGGSGEFAYMDVQVTFAP